MDVIKDCKHQQKQNLLIMEVKVLSAQSLKRPSVFSWGLRPYVALSATTTSDAMRELDEPPPFPPASVDATKGSCVLYRTRVDKHGGENPTWGDTVRLPLDPSFLHPTQGSAAPAVHLFVLSQRRFVGPARVGWCRIPACDIVDGLRPPCSVRRLSYALRNCHHGGRGHGIVDLAVRVVGTAMAPAPPPANAPTVVPGRELPRVQVLGLPPTPGWARGVAIGIPVRGCGLADAATGRKERGCAGEGVCAERDPSAGRLTFRLTWNAAQRQM